MKPIIMSGNEAAARGAYEAGCTIAAAYPGTPSTEILENIALYKENIYCQWAGNEKVAMEIVSGASIGGARALAAMKHVGLNVATDPMFTMGYAGVNGGMVIVSADDPGCHSSQNEQDSRMYAPHAKILMIEPSDSQECKDYIKMAFELSELFDTPVLFRMATRVCHSKSLVFLSERNEAKVKPYVCNPGKFAMLPATARKRHAIRESLLKDAEEYSNNCALNRIEWSENKKTGIITSGISYQYAREVFGDTVSYLKLGLTYPMPNKLIAEFTNQMETVYIIEEGEPYMENAVKNLGIACIGKDRIPICGELNAQIIREALTGVKPEDIIRSSAAIPGRPPVLCAGCPHRGFFYAIGKNKKRIVPVGDIGCYALGVNAPLNGFDYSICMGAGLSSPIGLAKALELQGDKRKALGMVGDSTFFHSGINSLIDIIHSQANVIACILDNSITAMTGHQENPGTVKNLMGEPAPAIDLVKLIRATDLEESRIRVVDPLNITAMMQAIDDACAVKGPFVIITKRPCALIKEVARANAGIHCKIDQEKCGGCKACMGIACPAMAFKDGKAMIADPDSCTGCALCRQLCRFDAIERIGE